MLFLQVFKRFLRLKKFASQLLVLIKVDLKSLSHFLPQPNFYNTFIIFISILIWVNIILSILKNYSNYVLAKQQCWNNSMFSALISGMEDHLCRFSRIWRIRSGSRYRLRWTRARGPPQGSSFVSTVIFLSQSLLYWALVYFFRHFFPLLTS